MEKLTRNHGHVYRVKIYIHGKPITKIFKRKGDAETWKHKKQIEKEQSEAFGIYTQADITLQEFSKIWIENKSGLARRSLDSYGPIFTKYLIPLFGHLSLKAIRISHGHALISHLKKLNLGNVRVNFCIRHFKQVLNDAVKWEYLIKNPLYNLEKLKEDPRSETYWLKNEISQFLTANQDHEFYELFLVALNTGLRRSELMGLQWNKVDFQNEQIEISSIRDRYGLKNTTKTGKIRYVPANKTTLEALLQLRKENRSMDYVFVHRNGKLPDITHITARIFFKAIENASVKKIRFHDLRTSFAANFCMSGGDIYTLSKILGHSSIEMTSKKYAHLHQSYMKKAVEIIEFKADSSNPTYTYLQAVKS